jgi:pimeloyl-ACP methyl ester carboxylesterase
MNKVISITANNLTFDCRVSGNPDDELVILLHGFPESAYMWKDLMEEISKQGFYCLAPNLRGYSIGARPNGKKAYSIDKLVDDVLGIVRFAGRDKFHLIGHDWGTVIGWQLVHDHPELILSWSGMSIPHTQAFGEAVVNDEQQRQMIVYMKKFQWPFLPELGIRKNDFAKFRYIWKNCRSDEVEDYLSVFRQKGALTASLHYYRSNYHRLRASAKQQILGDITVPTLFIWGEQDMAVAPAGVEKGHRYMTMVRERN